MKVDNRLVPCPRPKSRRIGNTTSNTLSFGMRFRACCLCLLGIGIHYGREGALGKHKNLLESFFIDYFNAEIVKKYVILLSSR